MLVICLFGHVTRCTGILVSFFQLMTFATLVQMNGGGLAGCLVRGAETIFGLGTGHLFYMACSCIAARIERVFPNSQILPCS